MKYVLAVLLLFFSLDLWAEEIPSPVFEQVPVPSFPAPVKEPCVCGDRCPIPDCRGGTSCACASTSTSTSTSVQTFRPVQVISAPVCLPGGYCPTPAVNFPQPVYQPTFVPYRAPVPVQSYAPPVFAPRVFTPNVGFSSPASFVPMARAPVMSIPAANCGPRG